MNISIVIPLLNEEESIRPLFEWIKKVMIQYKYTYEVLFIDDGSIDTSWKIIEQLQKEHHEIIGIKLIKNYGKSAALNIGFEKVKGDVVFTMDADLQDNPEELPKMYDMIMKEDYHIISGWKKKRYDPISKTLPTKLFNWCTRKASGIYLHDFNCGLKAYKNIVVKNIEVYGEMHRYIPVIAKQAGFSKIGEKVVQHQARIYGTTKFGGWERFTRGFLDLLSISFVSKYGKRPMHFFGSVGTVMFIIGFILTIYLGIEKIYYLDFINEKKRLVAENPLFFIALTTMIIGSNLFLTGFLAELISRNSYDRNNYKVEKITH